MDRISRRSVLLGTGASLLSAVVPVEAQTRTGKTAAPCPSVPAREQFPAPTADQIRRLKWWREARYGLFIHYGLYSMRGRQEWDVEKEAIPWLEYEKLAHGFSPRPDCAKE